MSMAENYLMLGADGAVVMADLGPMLARHRAGIVKARADAVGRLADALACESLDIMEVCEAPGLPVAMVDSATYAALVLRLAELSGE
jgi:hypothetical protein